MVFYRQYNHQPTGVLNRTTGPSANLEVQCRRYPLQPLSAAKVFYWLQPKNRCLKVVHEYLVGGWATPLKNMKVSWDDEIPNIRENKKWHPNHQPDNESLNTHMFCRILMVHASNPVFLALRSLNSVAEKPSLLDASWTPEKLGNF